MEKDKLSERDLWLKRAADVSIEDIDICDMSANKKTTKLRTGPITEWAISPKRLRSADVRQYL